MEARDPRHDRLGKDPSDELRTEVRVELSIRGRVQGVGFRWAAREEARLLGLRGWVRNLADRSVLLVAQGPVEAIAVFEAWCAQGPARARVDRVERREIAPAGDLGTGFEVRV